MCVIHTLSKEKNDALFIIAPLLHTYCTLSFSLTHNVRAIKERDTEYLHHTQKSEGKRKVLTLSQERTEAKVSFIIASY